MIKPDKHMSETLTAKREFKGLRRDAPVRCYDLMVGASGLRAAIGVILDANGIATK